MYFLHSMFETHMHCTWRNCENAVLWEPKTIQYLHIYLLDPETNNCLAFTFEMFYQFVYCMLHSIQVHTSLELDRK